MDQIYVVYHTTYSGDKFPQNYIGSTTLNRIQNGYRGSVRSKKFRKLWENELKENPELFYTVIISHHYTRYEALYKELYYQQLFNVVDNPLFVNMSYAKPNGFFGRKNSGKDSPSFGKKRTDKHWTKKEENHEVFEKMKNENSNRMKVRNKQHKFALGHKVSEEMKKFYKENNKKLRWYKNEITKDCVFSIECPEGYIPGRYTKRTNKGE